MKTPKRSKVSSATYGRSPDARAFVAQTAAQVETAYRAEMHAKRVSSLELGIGLSSPISPALYRQSMAIQWADAHPSALCVDVDVRLVSEANARGHWAKGAGRAHTARAKAFQALSRGVAYTLHPSADSLIVCLTRIGPRGVDDDNAARACKSIRDGVADWLRRDDGDASLTWLVQQARGPYGARIEVWRWEP